MILDAYASRYRINRPQDVFNRGSSGGGPPPGNPIELVEETVGNFGNTLHEETSGVFGNMVIAD